MPAAARSASSVPSRPRTSFNVGGSVTWKPVPRMIVSTSRSLPSARTIVVPRISWMPSVRSSTFGRVRAGYQWLESSTRLQPSDLVDDPRDELDRRGARPDDRDALALEVVLVVPFRGVKQRALEALET